MLTFLSFFRDVTSYLRMTNLTTKLLKVNFSSREFFQREKDPTPIDPSSINNMVQKDNGKAGRNIVTLIVLPIVTTIVTPIVTTIVTTIVTPIVTPIVTTIVTAIVTPIVTTIITPIVTTIVTPIVNPLLKHF